MRRLPQAPNEMDQAAQVLAPPEEAERRKREFLYKLWHCMPEYFFWRHKRKLYLPLFAAQRRFCVYLLYPKFDAAD